MTRQQLTNLIEEYEDRDTLSDDSEYLNELALIREAELEVKKELRRAGAK